MNEELEAMTTLLEGAQEAIKAEKISITPDQKKALDSMVFMYMSAVQNPLNLDEEAVKTILLGLDKRWEAQFNILETIEEK